jgi:4-amino-4-deoxy-L-arabinose transferase-like glycosyltransferase
MRPRPILHSEALNAARHHLFVLALLPLALLLLDRNWIFSPPHRDAWIYYGYYENGALYLALFSDRYYSSRVAAFLPGFALHHLLPPVAANVLLHLGLVWASLISFYWVVRDLFGRQPALLSALAFGCHPLLLHALGWNYVDGFGITYFLVALLFSTLATRSRRRWWIWAAAAGAAVTALACTNVFYLIYAPAVAGHFLVLNRYRNRRSPLRAGLAASAGGAMLLLALGVVTSSVGGPFFFLASSFDFLAERSKTANPFRDPTYLWLPYAVWLAVPVTALLGTIPVLLRSRGGGGAEVSAPILWSQLQLVYLAGVLVYFQVWGDTGVLQHHYYASLLIPNAFFALAGQAASLLPALEPRRFAGLALAVCIVLVLPFALPQAGFLAPQAEVVPAPLLWAQVAAAGALLALASARRKRATVVAFFACLAAAHLVIWQTSGIFRSFDRYGGDGAGLFRQMSRSVLAIEEFDPTQQVRLWYDLGDPYGQVYDAVATAFLLCPRMINLGFPDLRDRRLCDGVQLAPGMRIAVLSNDAAAFDRAAQTLDRLGFEVHLLGREEIPGPIPGYALTFLRAEEPELDLPPDDPLDPLAPATPPT